jgi:hypothetical protein
MTKDDIIRMARETDCLDDQHYGSMWADKLELFANLVAAAERDRLKSAAECFRMCEHKGVCDEKTKNNEAY